MLIVTIRRSYFNVERYYRRATLPLVRLYNFCFIFGRSPIGILLHQSPIPQAQNPSFPPSLKKLSFQTHQKKKNNNTKRDLLTTILNPLLIFLLRPHPHPLFGGLLANLKFIHSSRAPSMCRQSKAQISHVS